MSPEKDYGLSATASPLISVNKGVAIVNIEDIHNSIPAKVYYDDTELFSVKNIVEYLKNKTDDVWEGNYFPALIYPSLGIMLVRFHKQDGEHERMIEVIKDPDSDNCHQYPPPPLKEFIKNNFLPCFFVIVFYIISLIFVSVVHIFKI